MFEVMEILDLMVHTLNGVVLTRFSSKGAGEPPKNVKRAFRLGSDPARGLSQVHTSAGVFCYDAGDVSYVEVGRITIVVTTGSGNRFVDVYERLGAELESNHV